MTGDTYCPSIMSVISRYAGQKITTATGYKRIMVTRKFNIFSGG